MTLEPDPADVLASHRDAFRSLRSARLSAVHPREGMDRTDLQLAYAELIVRLLLVIADQGHAPSAAAPDTP